MSKPRVYVETSIPSFYYESRTEPEIVARRNWTRMWWADATGRYELVTSEAVIDEVGRGMADHAAQRLSLIRDLPLVPLETGIVAVVQTYLQHKLMPVDPTGDALHLALASWHKCDFLVTWNCAHLANANKFGHIRRINTMLGLFVPAIVTPLELLGETNEPRTAEP